MFSQNQSKYAPQENLPKVAEVRYLDADEVEIAVREQMIERMVEAQQRAENEESEELSSQTPATRSFRAKIFIEKNGFFPVYFYTNDWSEGVGGKREQWERETNIFSWVRYRTREMVFENVEQVRQTLCSLNRGRVWVSGLGYDGDWIWTQVWEKLEEIIRKWDNGGSVNKDYDCSDYGNKPKPINRRPSYSTEHLVLMSYNLQAETEMNDPGRTAYF